MERGSTTVPQSPRETIFAWGAPPLKFGAGVLDEIGLDAAALRLLRQRSSYAREQLDEGAPEGDGAAKP